MTPDKAFEIVVELEGLIELGGRIDQKTSQRFEELLSLLQDTGRTTGIPESIIRQMRSWAGILFSERKQGRWRRAADDIKNILRVHCISLREIILDAKERNTIPPEEENPIRSARR